MQRCSRPDDAARVIDDAGRLDPRNPAVPLQRAALLASRSKFDEALSSLSAAESLFRDRNNSEGLAEVFTSRGTFEQQRDRFDAADAALARADELARGLDDARQQIRVMLQRALLHRRRGDEHTADALTNDAIDFAHRKGLDTLTLEGLFAAGNVRLVSGDYDGAKGLFERALAIAEDNRHEEYTARGQLTLATLFVRTMQPSEALAAIDASRPYYQRINQTRNLAIADTLSGQIAIMRGQYEQAIVAFRAAVQTALQSDREREAASRENLATALAGAARYPEAVSEYRSALEIYRGSHLAPREAFALLNISDLESRTGAFDEARQALDDATRLDVATPELGRRTLHVRTRIALREGRYAEADRLGRQLLTLQGLKTSERLLQLRADLCTARAHLSESAAQSTCDEALKQVPRALASLWLETAIAAADARRRRGDSAGAEALAREARVVMDQTTDHDVRWKLLAVLSASTRPATAGAAEDVTRELRELRLKWGPKLFERWARRPDVAELLVAAHVHPGEVQ
jgi:tetratricopeptide (TPR) repeat protein